MTQRVGFIVFDGMTMLDLSGPGEVLHQARRAGLPYTPVLVSPHGGTVTASSGLAVGGTTAVAEAGALDTVIVVGADRLTEPVLDEDLLAAVRTVAGRAERVASVCTGAFVLAELGLLDGRRATTHWRHTQTLASRYPRVRVQPDVIHVRDGRYVTSAGITAGIDLALSLVEDDYGAEAARGIARELVVFMQRPGGQSQFSADRDMPRVRSSVLQAVTAAVQADPAGEHTLPSMSAAAAVSARHLTRLFQAELGTTPARWVERVRLGLAQELVLEGHSITKAAQQSGFGSDETLRRAFGRHLGITPTEYRTRFATTQPIPLS
ncbi:GlxA family transcriptional regulator [Arthrobacter sp. Helios]|uniref:GlxA family transcriptional regulator n=1 Tax=Arthrobacter sp. Helios TaxID=2828862 RepID=UPI002054C8CE|nr:GlxA family transcriptional regulator [Arthrobacter sp. Helios]UPO76369.1 GlxA family transcriptional regulator [Arthrobacter sp. Helios]